MPTSMPTSILARSTPTDSPLDSGVCAGAGAHPLLGALRGLGLPASDYVIFGSGPLLVHGMRQHIGDLDVVARGPAWNALAAHFAPTRPPSGHGHMIRLVIEVVDTWLPGFDTDRLIGAAERHHGLPFAPLSLVQASKRRTARPKDAADLAALAAAGDPVAPPAGVAGGSVLDNPGDFS